MLDVLKGEHSMTARVRKMKFPFEMKGEIRLRTYRAVPMPAIMGQGLGLHCHATALADRALHGTPWSNEKARRLNASLSNLSLKSQLKENGFRRSLSTAQKSSFAVELEWA